MADNKNTQAADVNEQIKIRMDKLKALQDAGKDPFRITKYTAGMKHAAVLRNEVNQVEHFKELESLCERLVLHY